VVDLDAVALVKLSAVSFCRSTICGLFTMSTLTAPPPLPPLLPPSPPPPPAPEQPASPAATTAVALVIAQNFLPDMRSLLVE